MSVVTPFPWPTGSAKTDAAANAETGAQLLFQNAPVGMAQCNALGMITAANAAFERLLGIEVRSAAAVSLSGLLQIADQEEMDALLREVIAGERESFQIETRTEPRTPPTRGDGQWVRWTVWRTHASGDSVCSLAMAEDATAGHSARRRPRQAERLEALGRLASGVAHDFNNLLTGVTLYSDLLVAGLEAGARGHGADDRALGDLRSHERESDERLRTYAEEIRAAAVHASGLVRQLLAVARVPNEAPHLLSLNQVAEEMRELLLRLIGENIELVYQLDPKLGAVRMDSTQARQILLNLVLNARDAMPEGGRITVETRNCGLQIVSAGKVEKPGPAELPCALFVVSDNGRGMDTQTQRHVFEEFFSTKPAGEGTGLGLSTVCDIVSNNGGLIHLDSAQKRGTRVTVLLPLIPRPMASLIPIPSLISLLPISPASTSPAELSNVSPGGSQPPQHEGALLFPEEESTP